MSILLTGGAGYIGTHTAIALQQHGLRVVVLDNFSNSHPEALGRVQAITGQPLPVVRGDVRDSALLQHTLRSHGIRSVIHLAGLKSVGDALRQPLDYYAHNVSGTLALLHSMQACGVWQLVFSSTANVYGVPQYLPLDEHHPAQPTNPYGRSKHMAEQMLADLQRADPRWAITVLRYCNPLGAHPSGLIGEDPLHTPVNLGPSICQVAAGLQPHVQICGDDYDTADGTGVRDYLHVMDLARGHLQAVLQQRRAAAPQWLLANLGTGRGHSVREVLQAFEHACARRLPVRVGPRRAGDIAHFYACCQHAADTLGWRAQHDLQSMCNDAWRWQSRNPQGVRSALPATAGNAASPLAQRTPALAG